LRYDAASMSDQPHASEASADATLKLTSPLSELPGVGKRRAQILRRLELETLADLIRHLPMRYEKELAEGDIDQLSTEGIASVRGVIAASRFVPAYGGRGKSRFEATLVNQGQRLSLTWFNAGYLQDKIHPGLPIRVQGQVKLFQGYPQMINPKWEALEALEAAPAREEALRPVYPAAEDMPSTMIHKLIAEALPKVLDQLVDPLPADYLREREMPSLADAYRMVHLPAHEDEPAFGRRRLKYNELLLLQMGIVLKRHYNQTRLIAPKLKWNEAVDQHIRQRLPFALTESQLHVTRQIAADLQRDEPMNRLLQGDVGAGKTAVAVYALLMAVADRRQGALMAPTEILAEQHFQSISRMLAGANVRLALMTSGQSKPGSAQRKALLDQIAQGQVDIVVGTQALLGEAVQFKDLALVVVDEQHRFGVAQRAAFREKNDPSQAEHHDGRLRSPHYLVMTATPIPRTLSLTIFGDLDVSIITGLPPGRQPIITRVVGPEKSDDVYRYITGRVAQGEQAYVVLPTIDESGQEQAVQLKSVLAHEKLLQDKFFQGYKVEAIHGRLKPADRDAIMNRFRSNQTQVLVATTIIEVGVDVPNATIMVIEHAERFGLAQLHQLRGRVGRGDHGRKSLCVLIGDPTSEESAKRLEAMAATRDGFKIAEVDLEIRGMGEFFGTRQHGAAPLRVARIPEDMDLLQMAKRDAEALVARDAELALPEHARLRRVLLQQYGQSLGLVDVG